MAKTITKDEAKRMVEEYKGSKFFTVTFVKRTTGETRVMNCRKGVKKYLTGGEMKYDPKKKNLVSVYDVKKRGHRSISLENIQRVKMEGDEEYIVE